MNIYEVIAIILSFILTASIFYVLIKKIKKDDKELENYKKERSKK